MNTFFAPLKLRLSHYRKIGSHLFAFIFQLTLAIYLFLTICLHGHEVSFLKEGLVLIKMVGVDLLLTAAGLVFLFLIEMLDRKRLVQ